MPPRGLAQWNWANGRGFGYAQKFDMSDTNNWKYLCDYNYKIFYQTIPDANRFKLNGRPVITIWTGNAGAFITNMQGNASQALLYVRQKCQADFGFNPYIILSQDFFSNDTTCNNPGVADASQSWFTAGPSGPSYTLTTKFGIKIGVAVSEFQHTGQSGFLDPNHGVRFETGLSNTLEAGSLLTLCEGFTDYEEDASMWRVRNIDAGGNPLGYSQTYYDYPNQRLNILREHSNWPFPAELTFEAEACDSFGGAAGGNGMVNFYRNGNIAVEPTADVSGTYDVGWLQPGEWFEWEQVPMQGSAIHLQARVACPNNNCQFHYVIDGVAYPAVAIPNTGGYQTWATVDSGPWQFAKGGKHTVRFVCDTGGFNFNYWRYHDDIPIGVNIYLQASNGKWISSAGASLTANVSSPGATELFTVVDGSSGYGHGYVALQSVANGLFVTAYTNATTSLIADSASVTAAQLYQWTDNGDGTIGLRAVANGRLISSTNVPASAPIIASKMRSPGTTETFTVARISTNALSFVAAPNDVQVATALTAGALGEVQVMAMDSSNNPVAGVTVTLNLASGAGTNSGNSALTDGGGLAHFSQRAIQPGGRKTLAAGSTDFAAAISSSFTVTAGAPATLAVESQPDGSGTNVPAQSIVAGGPVAYYSILRDSLGNFATNTPAAWSLVNITGGLVSGDLVAAGDGRSATLTGHLAGGARVQAVAGFTSQSGVQSVVGGPATQLAITRQPSTTAQVGAPFVQQPIVTETDAYGNLALTPVTVTETGGVGNVSQNPVGITGSPVNGAVMFSGLYVTNMGINSLTFTAGAVSIQSGNIQVGVGNATGLAWSTQPGNATNGFVFGTSPVIQTMDAGGDITTLGLPVVKYVVVSIYSGTGALLGTRTNNIGSSGANGTVVLTDLAINLPGTFQLSARDLGNGFNPTNISAAASCQLWLDAADTATFGGVAAGAAITHWNDKSGHANNASGGATFVVDPVLPAASPGLAQTIHFNGSQQLTMKLNSLSNSPYTILVVEVGAAKASGVSYFIGNNGGFNTDLTLGIGYQTATQLRWQQYADDLNYNAAFTNAIPRQWTMNLSGSPTITKRLYLNSAQVGSAGSAFLTGTNLVNGTVGYNSYLGDIAELVVYNSSLGGVDQTNVQDYLQNKWMNGMASAVTQPFTVNVPVYYPTISSVSLGQNNGVLASITFAGSGGPTNVSYRVLSSTNVSAPVATWTPVLTNAFDGSGAFQATIPVDAKNPAAFYRLAVP